MKSGRIVAQMGCDCHRKFSLITARDANGEILWRQRLAHGDREALRERLRSWPPGVPVVMEATFGWGWLCDEMDAAGLDPHLASSRKVAAWREARGLVKTDRTDADLLSELWSQQPRWWSVWLAPPAVREQREWLRYRMTLVRLQTGLKNRIHAVLHRHGIVHEFSDLFGVAGRRFLVALTAERAETDIALPASARATLRGYLALLGRLRGQISRVTLEFRHTVRRSPAARRLMTLPGVSWILAYTILAEVGEIERFGNGKHLASYSLLVPRAHETGGLCDGGDASPKGRHVGRVGRRTLKWAWIEAAHGAVRKSARFRLLFDRRTNEGNRDRNRGYIAVAHQLCLAGDAVWRKDVDYCESPPPRPGSQEKSKRRTRRRGSGCSQASRPGTGQPDHPMVAVVAD